MDIRTKIMKRHNEVMVHARKIFDDINIPDIPVKFNFRSANIAGQFQSKMNRKTFGIERCLRYNDKFAVIKENESQFFNETIPHEIAHYIAHLKRQACGGDRNSKRWASHGTEWKRVMTILGVNPERCHSMVAPLVRTKTGLIKNRFVYKCNCTEHKVTATIHNRIVKGGSYTCSKCKTSLKFVKELV